MIHDDLRTRLLADADIANLVSTRIVPLNDLQSTPYPKIVYRLVNEQPDYAASGNAGPTESVIEYVSQAESYATAKALDALVADSLDAHRGQVGSSFVHGIFTENISDDSFAISEGSDRYVYNVTRQIKVMHG